LGTCYLAPNSFFGIMYHAGRRRLLQHYWYTGSYYTSLNTIPWASGILQNTCCKTHAAKRTLQHTRCNTRHNNLKSPKTYSICNGSVESHLTGSVDRSGTLHMTRRPHSHHWLCSSTRRNCAPQVPHLDWEVIPPALEVACTPTNSASFSSHCGGEMKVPCWANLNVCQVALDLYNSPWHGTKTMTHCHIVPIGFSWKTQTCCQFCPTIWSWSLCVCVRLMLNSTQPPGLK